MSRLSKFVGGFLGAKMKPSVFGGGSGIPADPVPVAGASVVTGDSSTFTGGVGAWVPQRTGTIAAAGGLGILIPGATEENNFSGAQITGAAVAGTYYQVSFSHRLQSGTAQTMEVRQPFGIDGPYWYPAGTQAAFVATGRAVSTLVGLCNSGVLSNGAVYEIDDVLLLPLTLSSLISTRPYASADCDISVAVTRTAGTQAGLCARLDNTSSPANFIICYLDGAGNVKVDKCVGSTYTNVISGAITYGAGRILRLVCSGNNVSAYYHGTQVGSTTAVADAGIVSNKNHGLFSTYAANTFADYVAA